MIRTLLRREKSLKPSFEEFKSMAGLGNVIPLYREMLADTETPVSAYLKLRGEDTYSFLLESVEPGGKISRYSFLGVGPFRVFRSKGNRIRVEDREDGRVEELSGDPISELRRIFGGYRPLHADQLPSFRGGAVGYFAYDAIRLVERIPQGARDDLGVDDIVLPFFDSVIAFDNVSRKMFLISNVRLSPKDRDLELKYIEAGARIDAMERLLLRPVDPRPGRGHGARGFRSNIGKSDFESRVRRCKDYIFAGDVIQVVLSQRFEAEISADPFDIYRMLRVINPSPYMFYLDMGELKIFGSSPELMVRLGDGTVSVRPIAGTMPRGGTEEEDKALERELLSDEKERAEHIMLLDLGRNDVGRVSEFGSVRVTEQMAVERYSHVMHIVSNVRGRLREGLDCFDALFSCFPAGTVSGAPKVRAMEIIDELEPTRRGIYAGAIGYVDFSGNMDTCIGIRMIVVKGGRAYIQVGAGIVADSDPEREFHETVNKAKAMFRAIEMAENGVL